MKARRWILPAMFLPFVAVSAQVQQGVGGGPPTAYAEQNGKIYKAKRAIERSDTPQQMEPTFNRGSGCWLLWLIFTGINVCW